MELEEVPNITIKAWQHEADEKFLGQNIPKFLYGFNLSRPTFESSLLFHVAIYHTYTNSFNGIVFLSDSVSTFQIPESNTEIDPKDLFPMVDAATFAYAKVFFERTRQTTLLHHKIAKPKLEEVLPTLKSTVEVWEEPARAFKAEGRKNLLQFRDLPEIPEAKQFQPGVHHTAEQLISHKLHFNQPVTIKELATFEGLATFYKELDEMLAVLDYSSFTPKDELDFKNYILYAFRSTVLLSHSIHIDKVYRLIVNEDVTGSNDSITSTNFLTYPPLKIVKEKNVYNRGSTPSSTVFYGAQTIDTALKEIKPPVGKRVTIGVWLPKTQKDFVGYPIVHDETTIAANAEVHNAHENIRKMEAYYHPVLLQFMHYYIKLLAREYAKPVRDKREYMLSALFSEQIFHINDPNPAFTYDCILYPSVGNGFKTFNFAIKPAVIDAKFKLEKVIECTIREAFYEREPSSTNDTGAIALATVDDTRVTGHIINDQIIWEL